MANGRSHKPRRREVRRQVPRQNPSWFGRLRHRRVTTAVLYGLVFTALATLIALVAPDRPQYYIGKRVSEPVVARVAFTAIDRQRTEERKNNARQSVPAVYSPNEDYLRSVRQDFQKLLALASKSMDQIESDARQQLELNGMTLAALKAYVNEQGAPSERWQELQRRFIRRLFSLAVLRPDQYRMEQERSPDRITIRPPRISEPGKDESQPSSTAEGEEAKTSMADRDSQPERVTRYYPVWINLENTAALRAQLDKMVTPFPPQLQGTIQAMVMHDPQPTYLYDQQLHQQAREERLAQVEPVTRSYDPMDDDLANDVIVQAGTTISEHDLHLIRTEQQAYRDQQPIAQRWLAALATGLLMAVIVGGIWCYSFAYNQKLVRNPMRGLALTGLLLLMQALAAIFTHIRPEFVYITATMPTILAAIILTITYHQRFGLAMGALHAVLVMLTLDLALGVGLTILVGVGVAVAQLQDVRTRSKLVQVGGWSGLAMGAVAIAAALIERSLTIEGSLQRVLGDGGWALLAGVATGLVAQGVLPTIERMFKVTTAMTLKELNDASHPLLQRLAQQAPGTYQHSLRIADMAESAADAIAADGLLCRVGAMYHDVGKINKPQYFIENQGGGPNRHAKLSPAMSLLIIVGHVKDGIEMAREYGLPPVLKHFIESHHGTTLVEYFYHAARKQQEAEAKPGPSEFEFRYPGPKPQTKEAAILLLCDSVEGAGRSLSDPTPVRLDQVVHSMANKRLMDGQFDECNLTLKELARIEGAITKTLCAIYHGRIKYPDAEQQDDRRGLSQQPPTSRRQPAVS